jgi:hypothetical protein
MKVFVEGFIRGQRRMYLLIRKGKGRCAVGVCWVSPKLVNFEKSFEIVTDIFQSGTTNQLCLPQVLRGKHYGDCSLARDYIKPPTNTNGRRSGNIGWLLVGEWQGQKHVNYRNLRLLGC